MQHTFIRWFRDIDLDDALLVGGKNASLGEMTKALHNEGIAVPHGFAITTDAYRTFLAANGLKEKIASLLKDLDTGNIASVRACGKAIRTAIERAAFPEELRVAIATAYRELSTSEKTSRVAVRSSATTEDLPDASFAGQQESFLNIQGERALLLHVKRCFASLYTDRALSYRADTGFSTADALVSVGVQCMVGAHTGASGVIFTVVPENGFDKLVVINAAYGLGETVVQGMVTPDEFMVFKPFLSQESLVPIVRKQLGKKDIKMVYGRDGTKAVPVSLSMQRLYALSDEEVLALARSAVVIERHFAKRHGAGVDIEWAKDGATGKLYILQARPETVHARKAADRVYREYRLTENGDPVVTGAAVGTQIASGKVRVVRRLSELGQFKKGEVLVTTVTDPDWEPVMKLAAGIVTDKGGRTSHAAIVARELGVPAVVGTSTATMRLQSGKVVTLDCSSGTVGNVYEGERAFEVREVVLDRIPETRTSIMVNAGSPEEALRNFWLPVKGVGLGRLEFIISTHIGVHPNAFVSFEKFQKRTDRAARSLVRTINEKTAGYNDKRAYYVETLAQGIATIAAAFYPHDVIIRFSDFKSNEYRSLAGGELFEPIEANPMIGWRGAVRYYDEAFVDAFGFECAALVRVRTIMGFHNVIPMVPFCRTPEEGRRVIARMQEYGLSREADASLKVYVMCEIPSNVVRADAFLDIFDGMSIGSNDLTQLTLGLDRDAGELAHVGNENDEAVKALVGAAIDACKRRGKYVGICGQAPSDFPEFTQFLVDRGIDSISLNPDTVIKTIPLIAEKERGG